MKMDHKLIPMPNPLEPKNYVCSCGKWTIERPKIGSYGRTTPRAIFGRITMAHSMHLRAVARSQAEVTA